tara:strand:- start:16521 stop:19928 length:3408 start_codon:yes stop_codon:yes gene_type:complete
MGQEGSNFRIQQITVDSTYIELDSLSIIPNSEILTLNERIVSDSLYQIDYVNSTVQFHEILIGKKIRFSYRVFPIKFTQSYAHKSMQQIEQSDPGKYDYFTIKDDNESLDIFSVSGLNKNGSISRGVNFGNNQDLAVNSNLDLQLSGKISDDISIQAAISDNNLPIQPEGNTQQLQEFDRVFIRLFDDNSSLIAGDFLLQRPEGYFMNLNKKVQGGGFNTRIVTKQELNELDNGTLKTSINAAISRGKFARNIIPGEEGNQGPYQLKGEDNESFIIVLSGTEKVYVNGKLMIRGQDNDYVIDYNTSELTFTPRQLISKDMRIVVEFQYSERNYSRSVIFSDNTYQKEKLKVNFNVYSEQDHRNQPLQQELSDEEKRVLAEVGDSLNQAVVSGIDTIEFSADQVMYRATDTLGFQNVLVYSKNPDSAIYRARFSNVGQGNGNYEQIRSDANGRVFQWIAPVNGVPQGSYEPVIALITPKKRQMVTLGGEYTWTKFSQLKVEGAFTNNDVNTFSAKDQADNQSYGFRIDAKHSEVINSDSASNTLWNSKLFYEQRGADFQFIERYRGVEFDRDWNIRNLNLYGDEYLVKAQTGISKKGNYLNYVFGSFTKGEDYQGVSNGFDGRFKKRGFSVQSKGSYLTVDAINNSEFLRHYTTINQKVGSFNVGLYTEQERILFFQRDTDTLQASSFDRSIWKVYLEKGDSTSQDFYRLSYSEIYDYFPQDEELDYALKGENFDFEFRMANNVRSRLNGKVTYRKLLVKNNEITSRDEENTLLGQLDYNLKALKGFISSNTFYQIGSGFENQREFSFLEVNDGQGTHLWNDYNQNGVQELNEFEVAGENNRFQASYIKVYTPTNEFIRVFSNQFNQVLFLKPNAILNNSVKWQKLLARFSNKTTYRAERKTQNEADIYNPFNTNLTDSTLISVSSSFANTFYYNRLSAKFNVEYFFLDNKSKNLLTNGFESRQLLQHELRARYNLNRIYSIENSVEYSESVTASEFFSNRNFLIAKEGVSPKLVYQPSVKFRLSTTFNYNQRENLQGEEKAFSRSGTVDLQYNQAGKGSFSMSLSYIQIDFNAEGNSSLAFEMLDGLNNGNNFTWGVLWQRNLSSYLQLNLNYNGRKSEDLRTIHTGGMQVRAFF